MSNITYTDTPQERFRRRFKAFILIFLIIIGLAVIISPSLSGYSEKDVAKELNKRYGSEYSAICYGEYNGTYLYRISDKNDSGISFCAWTEVEHCILMKGGTYILYDNYNEMTEAEILKKYIESNKLENCIIIPPDIHTVQYNSCYTAVCTFPADYNTNDLTAQTAEILNFISSQNLNINFTLKINDYEVFSLTSPYIAGKSFQRRDVLNVLEQYAPLK